MPKGALFFPLLLLSLSLSAAAERQKDDTWHKEFALSGAPDVRIVASDASIRVTTWDEKRVDVTVRTENWTIGESGFRIRDYQSGDRVEIDAPSVATCVGICINFNRRAQIEVRVPRDGRFEISTKDGRIEATGLKGEVRLHTGDGRLTARDLDGSLRADTGDGHIEITGRFDDVDAATGDGGMEIEILPGSVMKNSWSFRSGDGRIRLRVPKDFAAYVDAHTGDGHIDVDLPITVSGRLREGTVRGNLNGGGQTLSLHSGDGSIYVFQ
jgi:DUF4097 and DUF4098 domain-containing protein YvlB